MIHKSHSLPKYSDTKSFHVEILTQIDDNPEMYEDNERLRWKATVRVTFDGNSSSRERLFNVFADLLHSYCLGQDRSIQAFGRPEIFYYSAIMVAYFSR